MMNVWKACFAAIYWVFSRTLVVFGWVSACPICGKRLTSKISGQGSLCSTCNDRLIEAQESLDVLEAGKSEVRTKKYLSGRRA